MLRTLPFLIEVESFAVFLETYCNERRKISPRFSVRQFAQRMGYKSPSLISDIINKKRSASIDFLERFSKIQELSLIEKQFIENLVLLNLSLSAERKALIKRENDLIRQCWIDQLSFDSQQSSRVSALDIMISAKVDDTEGISADELVRHYQGLISPSVILARLDHMLKQGVLKKDEDGKYLRGNDANFSRADSQSFTDLLEVIKSATSRVDKSRQQDILTLDLSDKNFKKAKEILRQACHGIYRLALEQHQNPTTDSSEIYTLYSVFFQTTNTDKNGSN